MEIHRGGHPRPLRGMPPPTIASWRSNLEVNGSAGFVHVHVPRKATAQLSRTLHRLQPHLAVQLEGPLTSAHEDRVISRGFAPPTSDLTKELILSRIQQQMTLI